MASDSDSKLPPTPYLNTNYVPSPDEILQITSSLSAPLAQFDKVIKERLRIERIYDDLCDKEEELSLKLEPYHALFSLPRRLTDDNLRAIFQHCLPTNHNAIMRTSDAPLLFTRVCSRWRQVALSTPRLWASIHIPIPGK
ncbi:hypothetical protein BDZ97DRAFT_1670874, partial [Flammula alnicola]